MIFRLRSVYTKLSASGSVRKPPELRYHEFPVYSAYFALLKEDMCHGTAIALSID